MVADDLRRQADQFIDLAELRAIIAREMAGAADVALAIGAYGGLALHAARTSAPIRVHPQIPVLLPGRGEPVGPAPSVRRRAGPV